jgi:hypothetical protein
MGRIQKKRPFDIVSVWRGQLHGPYRQIPYSHYHSYMLHDVTEYVLILPPYRTSIVCNIAELHPERHTQECAQIGYRTPSDPYILLDRILTLTDIPAIELYFPYMGPCSPVTRKFRLWGCYDSVSFSVTLNLEVEPIDSDGESTDNDGDAQCD